MNEKLKYIYVKWLDASFDSGVLGIDELDGNWICETIGILVKEDKEFLYIAMEYTEKNDIYRHIMYIPKCLVKQRKQLCIKK